MWVWSTVGHHSKSLGYLRARTHLCTWAKCRFLVGANRVKVQTRFEIEPQFTILYLYQWMNWNFVFGIINHPFCVLHALHFTKALMQILITTNFDVFFFWYSNLYLRNEWKSNIKCPYLISHNKYLLYKYSGILLCPLQYLNCSEFRNCRKIIRATTSLLYLQPIALKWNGWINCPKSYNKIIENKNKSQFRLKTISSSVVSNKISPFFE